MTSTTSTGLSRRQIRELSLAPRGRSLFVVGADVRTDEEKAAEHRLHLERMRHDPAYRRRWEWCIGVGHSRVSQPEHQPEHQAQIIPVAARARARSSRRAHRAAVARESGDSDGEPPQELRPFINALADLILADLTRRASS